MATKKNKQKNWKKGKEEIKKDFEHNFRQEWKDYGWKNCVVSKKISIFAVLLITVGFVALLQSFGIVPNAWARLWPLFLIVPGLIILARSLYKR